MAQEESVVQQEVLPPNFEQDALTFYKQAVETHEQGRDLETYLHSYTYEGKKDFDYGTWPLTDDEVAFVLAGRGKEEPRYNGRLRFIGCHNEEYISTGEWIEGQRRLPLAEAYKRTNHEQKLTDDEPSATGLDLNKAFDGQGRRRGRMEGLSADMVRLGFVMGDPELIQDHIPRLSVPARASLYFDAMQSYGPAIEATVCEFFNVFILKEALKGQFPEEYCRFLVREIAESDLLAGVDVDSNTYDALALLDDDDLFPGIDKNEFELRMSSRQQAAQKTRDDIKTDLNQALIVAQRPDLLTATKDQSLEEVQKTAASFNTLERAEHRSLTWLEKRRFRKAARAMLDTTYTYSYECDSTSKGGQHEACGVRLKTTPEGLLGMLALALADDQRTYKGGQSNAQTMFRAFSRNHPDLFMSYGEELIRGTYVSNFPLEAYAAGAYWKDVLPSLAANLAMTHEAEKLYQEVVSDERVPAYLKLRAAIAMLEYQAGFTGKPIVVSEPDYFALQADL